MDSGTISERMFFVDNYLIIVKAGIDNDFKKWICNNEDKNILVINTGWKNLFLRTINQIELEYFIKNFITVNPFEGVLTITTGELIKVNKGKFIKFYFEYIFDKIFGNRTVNKIEKSKLMGILFTLLGFGVIYFFYQLGYSFIYGFYFGGNTGESISILDMFVNPVPFNFKSIVAIGIAFLIYLAIIFIPLTSMIVANNKKGKIISFFIFVFSVVLVVVTCLYLFYGSGEKEYFIKLINLLISLFLLPISIVAVIEWFKLATKYGIIFFSSVLYSIIILVLILSMNSVKVNSEYVETVAIFGVLAVPSILIFLVRKVYEVLMTKILRSIKDKILYKIVAEIILYLPFALLVSGIIISIFKQLNVMNTFSKNTIFIVSLICLGTIIILKNIIKVRKESKFKGEPIKSKDSKNEVQGNAHLQFLVLPILFVVIMFFILIPSITVSTGRIVRESIIGLSKDKIIYGNNNEMYVAGNIVAQTENVQYISKYPERKLVTIKNSSVTSIPCETFTINHVPTRFEAYVREFSERYSSLFSNKNIIIDSKSSIDKDIFKYYFDIKLYNNPAINKSENDYVYRSTIAVEYPIDGIAQSKNLYIMLAKYLPKNVRPNNLTLKKDIEKVSSDYQEYFIKYFNLPKIDNIETKYYFSNALLSHDIIENSNNNEGRYAERYVVSYTPN